MVKPCLLFINTLEVLSLYTDVLSTVQRQNGQSIKTPVDGDVTLVWFENFLDPFSSAGERHLDMSRVHQMDTETNNHSHPDLRTIRAATQPDMPVWTVGGQRSTWTTPTRRR